MPSDTILSFLFSHSPFSLVPFPFSAVSPMIPTPFHFLFFPQIDLCAVELKKWKWLLANSFWLSGNPPAETMDRKNDWRVIIQECLWCSVAICPYLNIICDPFPTLADASGSAGTKCSLSMLNKDIRKEQKVDISPNPMNKMEKHLKLKNCFQFMHSRRLD